MGLVCSHSLMASVWFQGIIVFFYLVLVVSLYYDFLVPASIVLYSSLLLRANLEQVSFNILFIQKKKNGKSLEKKKINPIFIFNF
jgi:hypothetical protein